LKDYNKEKFNKVNSVLENLKISLGLDIGMKQQEFSKLWPKIVGTKFKNNSKVASIVSKFGKDTLYVAVSSPAVAQELSFFKKDLLQKIQKITDIFNITEIIFDYKLWEEILKESESQQEKTVEPKEKAYKIQKKFSDEELEKIELSEEELKLVEKSFENQSFFSEEMAENFKSTIIKNLKIQKWQKQSNFPVCEMCGIPLTTYYPDRKNFCPVCKCQK